MITPPLLRRGDRVALVAPAGKITKDVLDVGVRKLEQWGLRVTVGENVMSKSHSYLSGSDSERLEDLQAALDSRRLTAIFCARGGYGTTRILDQIDFSRFRRHPKWIIGFSDITALHLLLSGMGYQTIHGAMPSQFGDPAGQTSLESLHRMLFHGPAPITTRPDKANVEGSVTAEVIGGNLSIFMDSMGTPIEPETAKKILIIEEIEEFKYKLDRMMTQLKRTGKLDKLAGLIIGYMTNIKDSNTPFGEPVNDIVRRQVEEFGYPVAFNFPIGHEHPNMAWRHGSRMSLTVTSDRVELTPS